MFEVSKPVPHVTRLEMSSDTAAMFTWFLHLADSGWLTDEEYIEFNDIRKHLSQANG